MVARAINDRVIYANRADIPSLKKKALELAETRVEYFAARYGVSFGAISIGAQKSRWGSCSADGELRFNYKIALLPQRLADYVVVHELCHRLQFDHSKKFWAHVSVEIPEHKKLRKELRETNICFS